MSTISPRKVEANRENARKSTGPTSPEGKAKVRHNALKHGLLARDLILPDEDPVEFDALLHDLIQHYAPVGPIEMMLVERIAVIYWRLGRAVRCEVGSVTSQLVELEPRDGEARSLTWKARDLKQRADRAGDLRKKIEQSVDGAEIEFTKDDLKNLGWDRASTEAELMKVKPADKRLALLGWIDVTRAEFLQEASKVEARAVQEQAKAMRIYEAKKVASSLPLYDRTLRYETTFDRQLYRAIDELEKRQRNRRLLSTTESSDPQSA